MTELMQASRQWASRPDDERFCSLDDMLAQMRDTRGRSMARVAPNRALQAVPVDGDHKGLLLIDKRHGEILSPNNWSFGQISARASAPASYMRTLPSEIAADCLNYGLQSSDVAEVGLLARNDGLGAASGMPALTLAAATSPNYGRIWNEDIIAAVIKRFGDGLTGDFRVPGEFGKRVPVTKANTTLYASDRDMFIFLADEEHRIEVPGRRRFADGTALAGSMARGFFMWNSEVGSSSYGLATFLFDYVCCNRIVWGAQDVKELKIRHTSGAPDRFIEEVAPALITYANSSTLHIDTAIAEARKHRLDDLVDDFLSKRFTTGQAKGIKIAHEAEEHRPIETIWDVVTGATAYAKGIQHQDQRIQIERTAGKLLSLVA